MTKRIPQPRSELSPSIRTHEAQLLAVMLRTSRLTCVFGEPGTDKSTLLKSGLLPLLQRRQGERAAAVPAQALPRPATERRRSGAGQAGPARLEAAIYFDAWGGDTPLAALKSRVGDLVPAAARAQAAAPLRLAESLDALARLTGFHFFFLLDRFEEFLALAPDEGDRAAFANELVEALLRPRLPASFLIAVNEDARPRLERLRSRVPGFDHNSLRLSPIATLPGTAQPPMGLPGSMSDAAVAGGDAASIARAGSGAVEPAFTQPKRQAQRRGPPPRVPIKVEEVYAFIESTLAKTARSRADFWPLPIAPSRGMLPGPPEGSPPTERVDGKKPPEQG